MPAVPETDHCHEIDVAQLRKEDVAELRAWAQENGISETEMGSQMIRLFLRAMSHRKGGQGMRGENVLLFERPT